MMRNRGLERLMILAVLLVALSVPAGCGGGKGGVSYIAREGGVVVGGETVSVTDKGGTLVYEGTQYRPFRAYDTRVFRSVVTAAAGEALESYTERRSENGAALNTYMSRQGDVYRYLQDNIQTFDYFSEFWKGRRPYPLERDSACLAQAVLDRFLASKLEQAVANVVVPSSDPYLREVVITKETGGRVKVSGEGFGDMAIEYDGKGVVTALSSKQDDIELTLGDPGGLKGRPYAPGEVNVKEVKVPTPDHKELAGAFYVPRGKPPYRAVALAPDVGPEDRTGLGVLSQLAARLAEEGIAVLVCDKRGVGESGGDYRTYTLDSAAIDLNAQMDYLTLRPDVDINHIGLVGYGEGGIAAALVATENPYVTACVLMAAPSVRMFPDLAARRIREGEQSGALSPVQAATRELTVGNMAIAAGSDADFVDLLGHRVFLGWIRSQADSDPPVIYGSLKMPVQVVQGTLDTVVTPGAATEIMKALEGRPGGKQQLALFEGLGHGFGGRVDEARAKPYRAHTRMDERVPGAIAGFLKEQLGVR